MRAALALIVLLAWPAPVAGCGCEPPQGPEPTAPQKSYLPLVFSGAFAELGEPPLPPEVKP